MALDAAQFSTAVCKLKIEIPYETAHSFMLLRQRDRFGWGVDRVAVGRKAGQHLFRFSTRQNLPAVTRMGVLPGIGIPGDEGVC